MYFDYNINAGIFISAFNIIKTVSKTKRGLNYGFVEWA